MSRGRFFTLFLVLLLSLISSFNALALCFLEDRLPAKGTDQIPSSISCLDNEEYRVLSQVDQGHKKVYCSKIEKRAPNSYHVALLQREPAYRMLTRPSGTIHVPFLIPIYQSKTVYRI